MVNKGTNRIRLKIFMRLTPVARVNGRPPFHRPLRAGSPTVWRTAATPRRSSGTWHPRRHGFEFGPKAKNGGKYESR